VGTAEDVVERGRPLIVAFDRDETEERPGGPSGDKLVMTGEPDSFATEWGYFSDEEPSPKL